MRNPTTDKPLAADGLRSGILTPGIRPATLFLRLALRRAARGTGSQPEFYTQRTAVQLLPDLPHILGAFNWVLVGGVALRAFMPERMTLDVDILIHQRDAAGVQAALANAGYSFAGDLSIGGFTMAQTGADTMPIDVLTRSDSWLAAALANPVYDSAGYPVLARPYLLLIKLQAGRTQDLADIQRLLAGASPAERATIRILVAQSNPELIEDFDSLVILADLEFGPPPEV